MTSDDADFASRLLEGAVETLRLYELADRLGIERTGDPGWGLELARALARQHIAEFEPPKRKGQAGRPLQKNLAYQELLATAVAHEGTVRGRRGAAARVARGIAEIEAGGGSAPKRSLGWSLRLD